ncbi:MAG TPA: RecQ family ATP-dependent DNA helicase, partial [Terriglobia bacterium]|nr:RecQ family ATP-dependent DNA helicase [Terriglobia bacterium]
MDTRAILKERFGFDDFRPAQREVIDYVLQGQSILSVMPTGSGKSLCYQLPALLLPGLTLVVSPLIALMKDQTDQLERLGVPAGVINSTVRRDLQRDHLDRAAAGELKLLYVAPERFQNEEFMAAIRKLKVSLFAVDEAHCVSLWGHDFRPDYLRLRRAINNVGDPTVVALTATATPTVRADILKQLGIEGAPQVVSGFDRPNLYLEVREVATGADKARAIVDLSKWGRTGIIYAGTRRNVDDIHRSLRRHNVDAVAYHAGLSVNDRKAVQERFMSKETGIIVATNAFGMGIDRSDVRFVVHADIPDSLEAYYQEVGRAGRDGQPAHGLLLFNYADKWIPELFIDASHPPADFLKQVFGRLLAVGQPVIIGDKWRQVTSRMDQKFHSAVTILHRAGYVERVHSAAGSGVRILRPTEGDLRNFNFEELERRRDFEHRKLRMMLEYASRFRKHCYRSFVLRYFGEWSKVKDCGNCSRCAPVKRDRVSRAAEQVQVAAAPRPEPQASPPVAADSTVVVLKILSCILRASEQLGREKIAKILAGSNDVSIQSFKSLTTYGILPGYSIRS